VTQLTERSMLRPRPRNTFPVAGSAAEIPVRTGSRIDSLLIDALTANLDFLGDTPVCVAHERIIISSILNLLTAFKE
jgi:hypothetical protein